MRDTRGQRGCRYRFHGRPARGRSADRPRTTPRRPTAIKASRTSGRAENGCLPGAGPGAISHVVPPRDLGCATLWAVGSPVADARRAIGVTMAAQMAAGGACDRRWHAVGILAFGSATGGRTCSKTTSCIWRASCEKRVRPSFCSRRRGERGSADGTQRSQDGSDRHRRRGAGEAGVHGACLPVMRASTREEMRRISFTSRSSSRLFWIHSR